MSSEQNSIVYVRVSRSLEKSEISMEFQSILLSRIKPNIARRSNLESETVTVRPSEVPYCNPYKKNMKITFVSK